MRTRTSYNCQELVLRKILLIFCFLAFESFSMKIHCRAYHGPKTFVFSSFDFEFSEKKEQTAVKISEDGKTSLSLTTNSDLTAILKMTLTHVKSGFAAESEIDTSFGKKMPSSITLKNKRLNFKRLTSCIRMDY